MHHVPEPSVDEELSMAERIQEEVISRRTVWSAVFSGVVIVLVVQLTLALLGLSIGASTFNPTTERSPASGLGVGTVVWMALTTLVALFAGGWFAGRLAACADRAESAMHGVLTWGVASLASMLLVTTAVGRILSGGASLVGQLVGAAGQTVAAVAPEVASAVGGLTKNTSATDVKRTVREILSQTRRPELSMKRLEQRAQQVGRDAKATAGDIAKNPQAAGDEIEGLLNRVFAQGRNVLDAVDRDALVNVVVARTDLSRPEAERTVDGWWQTFQSTRAGVAEAGRQAAAEVRQVAERTAEGVSKVAFWTFVAMLLGAGAGALGGWFGSPLGRRTVVATTHLQRSAA